MKVLASRRAGAISVRLFWDDSAATGRDLVIEYEDRGEEVSFMFHPPRDRALDAFYHPNAYVGLDWRDAA
jgi:hypothetical protein